MLSYSWTKAGGKTSVNNQVYSILPIHLWFFIIILNQKLHPWPLTLEHWYSCKPGSQVLKGSSLKRAQVKDLLGSNSWPCFCRSGIHKGIPVLEGSKFCRNPSLSTLFPQSWNMCSKFPIHLPKLIEGRFKFSTTKPAYTLFLMYFSTTPINFLDLHL